EIFDDIECLIFHFLRKGALSRKLLHFFRKRKGVFMRLRSEHRSSARMERTFYISLTSASGAFLTKELLRRARNFTSAFGRMRTLAAIGKCRFYRKPHRMLVRLDPEDRFVQGNGFARFSST